jgi:prolyl 4-hydroxylase
VQVFPYAEDKVEGEGWSECALRGLAVKAKKGNALLFYGLNPDGTTDSTSTHGSCPVSATPAPGRRCVAAAHRRPRPDSPQPGAPASAPAPAHALPPPPPPPPPQTLRGTKWSATKWIHVGSFNKALKHSGCADSNDRCEVWAAAGECDSNPSYMHSTCPLSCGKCSPEAKTGRKGGLGRRGAGRAET